MPNNSNNILGLQQGNLNLNLTVGINHLTYTAFTRPFPPDDIIG